MVSICKAQVDIKNKTVLLKQGKDKKEQLSYKSVSTHVKCI